MTHCIKKSQSIVPEITSKLRNSKKCSAVLLGVLLSLAVAGTSLVAVAASQPAGGQSSRPADLDPDDCESTTGFKPTDTRTTDLTVAQCRALVRFRNAMFANNGHQNLASHSMAQWGTGSGDDKRMNNWIGIQMHGSPFQVDQLNLSHWQAGANGRQNRANGAYLAGPIPDLDLDDPTNRLVDSDLFSNLFRVEMGGNLFTGGFPEWIYNLPGLKFLGLGGRLTGPVDGGKFVSNDLNEVILGANFSGPLPNFKFTDGGGNPINQNLTRLNLGGNSFSGSIPSGYRYFADGRPMNELNLSYNLLSGNIPSWVRSVKFSTGSGNGHRIVWNGYFRNRMSFSGNLLCIPSNFTIPTLYEAGDSTTVASVQIDFSRNRCPTRANSSLYTPGPVRDLEYEIPADNRNALKVSWKPPTDDSGYKYWLTPVKLVPDPIDNSVSVGDWCAVRSGMSPNSAGIVSATIDADAPAHPDCRFDPTKFAADVLPIYEVGTRSDNYYANSYTGESSVSPGWNIVHVKERRSAQEIGFKLGIGLNRSFWTWNTDTQNWVRWALADPSLDSSFLQPGTSIITTFSRPPAWLALAGLGSADENLNVQLANGWNMISAGGDITRPDDNEGAFFFDDMLVDCDSLRGAVAVLAYRPRLNRFDVELPCHSNSERILTNAGVMGTFDELKEYDSLFVYFNAALPVTITWDDTNKKYIPATS